MPEYLLHIISTLIRLTVSMVIAFAAAFPLALLFGRMRNAARLFDPLIEMLYSVPKIALFPLIVLLIGLNDRSRVITATIVVFFQVLITVRDAAAVIPEEYIISIDSLGAGRIDRIRYVYIPFLLPSVFTSLRVGTAAAFAVLFFTEASVTSGYGMGRLVIEKWSELDYKAMGLSAIITSLMGVVIFILIDRLESRLLKGVSIGTSELHSNLKV
ncbi:MAG: ABC transporter permease subunit [Spirochaetales bacterium]|uniref:ABC transporter permease subunit n=1 Tax=Candidatus Thalassospirochaeta sargassi TaxID=3119039 RepID=A0AAJ1IEQ9_9SPIO|nr:ABC transporter permease subunit [Spirochaetales bacterium]